MKKMLSTLVFLVIALSAFCQEGWVKLYAHKKDKVCIRMIEPSDATTGWMGMVSGNIKEDPVSFTFNRSTGNCLQVFIHNLSDEKITVLWNDAQFGGDKIAFGEEKLMSLDNRKDNETIYPHKSNSLSTTSIIPKNRVHTGYNTPLFWDMETIKESENITLPLQIPIIVNGEEKLYEFKFEMKYFPNK